MSESKTISLIAVPTIICVVAGLALAFVYDLTKEPIALAQLKAKNKAIAKVLPEGDEEPVEMKIVDSSGTTNTFYVMRKESKLAGVALDAASPNGYSGNVSVMVGIDVGFNQVQAVEILKQQETPGLGANCKKRKFREQFCGRDIDTTNWRVTKDGGDLDAITSATITSRAVAEAISTALKIYNDNRDALIKQNEIGELAPIEEVLN
jgi:electron transport complex protein RnfG